MKLVKSLLLGSAAGIAAVAGAQAADLPSRKAAPVEYVRVCSAYGAGFFYLPGTDTCLRVGGRVRAEYTVGTTYGDYGDAYGMRARGRLNVDARTATAYGTLRTYFRYELTNSTGLYNGTIGGNQGIVPPGTLRTTGPSSASSANLDLAFIQFGPITAGRAQSFFDFYANDYTFSTLRTADSRVNLLAYTATFGSGFSATLSVEDRISGTQTRENTVFASDSIGTIPGLPIGGEFGGGVVAGYTGQDFPDIVASLRVDQGWGSAQLSGAFTQRNTNYTLEYADGTLVNRKEDDYGWAIQGGVKINLPMLAAGDVLFLQAAYADGALGYLGWNGQFGSGRIGSATEAYRVGDFGITDVGSLKSSTGWSLVAVLRHFWTPELRSEFFGSYSELKLGYNTATALQDVNGNTVFRSLDPKELIVGANLIWSPVSGLDIGVEVLYTRTELKAPVFAATNDGSRGLAYIKSDDAFAGRLRIQRDF
jgi:hypothetical protein